MSDKNRKLAREIADAVIADFSDRSGMLDDIDDDVMDEIKEELDSLVYEKLETADGR